MATPPRLSQSAARDIRLLRRFLAERDRRVEELIGRRSRQDPLRYEILRDAALADADSLDENINDYQVRYARLGARATIRSQIDFLVDCNLVELTPTAQDRREMVVKPTAKLIEFYNSVMPSLEGEVLKLCLALKNGDGK